MNRCASCLSQIDNTRMESPCVLLYSVTVKFDLPFSISPRRVGGDEEEGSPVSQKLFILFLFQVIANAWIQCIFSRWTRYCWETNIWKQMREGERHHRVILTAMNPTTNECPKYVRKTKFIWFLLRLKCLSRRAISAWCNLECVYTWSANQKLMTLFHQWNSPDDANEGPFEFNVVYNNSSQDATVLFRAAALGFICLLPSANILCPTSGTVQSPPCPLEQHGSRPPSALGNLIETV